MELSEVWGRAPPLADQWVTSGLFPPNPMGLAGDPFLGTEVLFRQRACPVFFSMLSLVGDENEKAREIGAPIFSPETFHHTPFRW